MTKASLNWSFPGATALYYVYMKQKLASSFLRLRKMSTSAKDHTIDLEIHITSHTLESRPFQLLNTW